MKFSINNTGVIIKKNKTTNLKACKTEYCKLVWNYESKS